MKFVSQMVINMRLKFRSWKVACYVIGIHFFFSSLEDLESFQYRRVQVRGKFNHEQEMVIGPRSNLVADESHGLIAMDATAKIGVNIITPLKLSDRE